MARSKKDARNGHAKHDLSACSKGHGYVWGENGRRFAKRWKHRLMRRGARDTIRSYIFEIEDDRIEDQIAGWDDYADYDYEDFLDETDYRLDAWYEERDDRRYAEMELYDPWYERELISPREMNWETFDSISRW